MRVLVCSKRDLSSVVLLNDLLERLGRIPGCAVSLMLAERTRTVETVVPELIHMKAFERDLPFGVLFPLIEGSSIPGAAAGRPFDEIVSRYRLPIAGVDRGPVPVARRLLTLNRLIERYALPCLIVRRLEDEEVLETAEAFSPDVILSVRFSFIFRQPFFALAKHGVINVHPGRLPDFAGLYPHFYSMLAGEQTLGCTVHLADEGVDSGEILATGEVPIDRRRSAFAHNLESHLLGNRLVAGIVGTLAGGGDVAGVSQDASLLRHHTYPTSAEFEAFRTEALSLIDMREYVELLKRFGLFDGVLPSWADVNCRTPVSLTN
jgi:methionyl-tRNA formyltransferase